jgi:CheY-like chemotaxis protein
MSARAPESCRILAVDDNVDSAESLRLLLEITGHEVLTAHNGPAALDAARQFQPHIVLLDIGLPGMNGYEVAQRLRAQPGMEKALLVALTGYSQDDDRRRSQEAGFNAHLVKPADLETLQALFADFETAAP